MLVAILVGCVDEPPLPIAGESHVFSFDHPGWLPRKVDVLFAIDDAPALEPYVARIPALAPALVGAFGRLYTGMPSVQIGVVTPSRALADVIVDTQNVDGTRTPNFDGTLADAITARLDVGAASAAAPSLFDAVHAALPTFARPNGELLLVTISARDDASSGAPTDYASHAMSFKPSAYNTHAVGIYPPNAARMDAFHLALHSYTYSIDLESYDAAFDFIGGVVGLSVGSPCIPEPATPHQCSIIVTDEDGSERVLPTTEYEIKADPLHCGGSEPMRVSVRGYKDPYRPTMRGECVAR